MLFGFENVKLCCSSDAELLSFNRGLQYQFIRRFIPLLAGKMGDHFHEYQFDIASPHYSTSTPCSSSRKVVFFFGEEKPETPGWLKRDYHIIFRQYLDQQDSSNIFPMPLGIDNETPEETLREMSNREIDIFFSGNMNAHRIDLYRALLKKNRAFNSFLWKRFLASRYRKKMPQNIYLDLPNTFILFTDGFFKGLSSSDYLSMLCNSVCVICPQGYISADTMRHYEAMKFGCIALSTAIPNNDLYRNSPHIFLKGWEEMAQVAECLCGQPLELERMHRAAREWWRETGSEAGFAEYAAAKILDTKLPDSTIAGFRSNAPSD